MRSLVLIFVAVLASLAAQAQIVIVPREKLQAMSNPKLTASALAMKFETMYIKADPMGEDDGVQNFTYPFKNIGEDTLKIRRTVATCSCMTVVTPKMTLAPGESSEIVVKYNPKGHPGRFERRIFVYTEDYADPAAVLSLNVNVSSGEDLSDEYPVQMGHIRMRRNALSFKQGIKSVEKIRFVNLSEKPLRLECEGQFLPESMCFSTRPEIVEAGEEGEIVITYDPEAGETRSRVPVIIRNLGVSPGQATINVSIE